MQKSSILQSILVSFLAFNFATSAALAFDEYRTFRTGEVNFEGSYRYYQATGNYDNGSKFSSQPSGTNYKISDGVLGLRSVFFPRFGFSLTADYANAQSNDGVRSRSNSGFTSMTAGIDYLAWAEKNIAVWPEFTFKYPFQRVDYLADGVLLDEGDIEATARVVGRLRWKLFDSYAYLGYRYRDEGRSGVLLYGIGSELPAMAVKVGAELSGYQTVVDDSGTGNIYYRDAVASRDGYSLYFDSINPSKLDFNAWVKWNNEPYQVKVGGGTTIMGTNTSGGWWAFVDLQIQMLAFDKTKTPSTPVQQQPGGQKFDSKQFREETDDGVDQSLFQEAPPLPTTPPSSSAPLLDESTPPVVKPKKPTPAERAQMQREQQQKLQNDLDQTEMQIELKSKKDHNL